jgi:hypothetical protein
MIQVCNKNMIYVWVSLNFKENFNWKPMVPWFDVWPNKEEGMIW